MAHSPITGIDHPIVAVRDLRSAKELYERMGFHVSPRGTHKEWGTGNCCIMFDKDYLELRSVVDSKKYTHNLDQFLDSREGLMGIAFGSEGDAEDVFSFLRQRGVGVQAVSELTRQVVLPEGNVEPASRLVLLRDEDAGPLQNSLVCEHLTPELMRKPEFLMHPNGTLGIAAVTAVSQDLDAATSLLERCFDAHCVHRYANAVVAEIRGAKLLVVTPTQAKRQGIALPFDKPYLAAINLLTNSIQACESALDHGDIPFVRRPDGALRVGAAHAGGVTLEFSQAH